jgi:plastocyanin
MLRSPLAAVRAPFFLPAIGGALCLFLPVSLPAAAAAPAKAQSIQIHNFAFAPAVLTVARGTTITWTNADEDPHTVTATGRAFHSAALDTGNRFSFTFNTPGEFAYFCSLHPHMTGKVVVRAN